VVVSSAHDTTMAGIAVVAADIMEATMEVITKGIMAVTIDTDGQRCHTA